MIDICRLFSFEFRACKWTGKIQQDLILENIINYYIQWVTILIYTIYVKYSTAEFGFKSNRKFVD